MEKILFIEDEKNIVFTIKLCLENAGFEVTAVGDGLEALDLALKKDWDLILLDLRLPRMDGFMICEGLAKEKKLKKIPVIVLSALSDEEDKKRAWSFGISDYIVKPVEAEELLLKVKHHLRRDRRDEES